MSPRKKLHRPSDYRVDTCGFRVGQRVRLHPLSVWARRGAEHGVITSIREGCVLVQIEGMEGRAHVPYHRVLTADHG